MWYICIYNRFNNVVKFDDANNYPTLELKLSDVADMKYIPHGELNDSVYIQGFSNKAHEAYVTSKHVYMLDGEESIVTFDHSGKFINKLNRVGRGPEEYIYVAAFAVNEAKDEIIVYDEKTKRVCVYDTENDFKRYFDVDIFFHTMVGHNKYRPNSPLLSIFSFDSRP